MTVTKEGSSKRGTRFITTATRQRKDRPRAMSVLRQ